MSHSITTIQVKTHSDIHPIYTDVSTSVVSFAHGVERPDVLVYIGDFYETFSLSDLKHLPVLPRWTITTDCRFDAAVGACHSHC